MESSDIEAFLADARDRMAKAVTHTKEDLAGIRTGRASPALVEHLIVEYYGSEVPLAQLASFSVPEPRMLIVSPFDPSSIAAIEKAIQSSDLGITPANDGKVIRLAFPPLTEERRREMVKIAKHKAEEGRVAVRNVRRATRHELEKLQHDGEISSDDLERAERQLEELTHQRIEELDKALSRKEQELLED
jgi:ribosome recycling factor